jgi:hypothetical protein
VDKVNIQTVKRPLVFLITIAAVCMAPSYSQGSKMALLLQQTPVNGGSVEPGIGVHRLDGNSQITLRAVPQPGYQFVTWLGDVAEPTSSVTEAYMDSPKIVVAVFERAKFDSLEAADLIFNMPGGGLMPSAADIGSQGGSGAGGRRPGRFPGILPSRPRPQEEDDFPVPEEGEISDLPVPGQGEVPEPATVLLLLFGATIVRTRRKYRNLKSA